MVGVLLQSCTICTLSVRTMGFWAVAIMSRRACKERAGSGTLYHLYCTVAHIEPCQGDSSRAVLSNSLCSCRLYWQQCAWRDIHVCLIYVHRLPAYATRYNFNDSDITKISKEDIVSSASYMLFYRRRDVDPSDFPITKGEPVYQPSEAEIQRYRERKAEDSTPWWKKWMKSASGS